MRFFACLLAAIMLLSVPAAAQASNVQIVTDENQVVFIPVDMISDEELEEINGSDDEPDEVGEFLDNIDYRAGDGTNEGHVYPEESLYLAAQLIYAEGASQSQESFEAMAGVLYNRLKAKKFPRTIEGVVFQKNQFTVTRNQEKFLARVPSKDALDAITKVFINDENPLPENVMFFKSSRLSKKWGSRVFYKTIGGNHYYK